MFNLLRWTSFLAIVVFNSAVVFAQSPETQRAVLADLNRRTGQTLEFNLFSSWNWVFGTYSYVISQGGCAAAPTIAPTTGDWQRYNITYAGVTYNYIVSDNAQSVILCNEVSLSATVVVPTIPPLPTLTPSPAVFNQLGEQCELPPRLVVNSHGRVAPGEPNWVHAEPSRSSEKLGEIPAGQTFSILASPQCDPISGMNYWQILYGDLTGWTSEGVDGEYWLEPLAGRVFIVSENAAQLTTDRLEQAIQQRHPNGVSASAMSDNGARLATADLEGTIVVWDVVTGAEHAVLEHPGGVASMAFRPDGVVLATGGIENNIYLWNIVTVPAAGNEPIIRGGRVNGVAFNPLGRLLAAINPDGSVSVWDVTASPHELVITLPSTGMLHSIRFSSDNTRLIASSDDGQLVRIWSIQE